MGNGVGSGVGSGVGGGPLHAFGAAAAATEAAAPPVSTLGEVMAQGRGEESWRQAGGSGQVGRSVPTPSETKWASAASSQKMVGMQMDWLRQAEMTGALGLG